MLLMDTKNCLDVSKEWLAGAIDMHVHAAPDCASRKYTDAELASKLDTSLVEQTIEYYRNRNDEM